MNHQARVEEPSPANDECVCYQRGSSSARSGLRSAKPSFVGMVLTLGTWIKVCSTCVHISRRSIQNGEIIFCLEFGWDPRFTCEDGTSLAQWCTEGSMEDTRQLVTYGEWQGQGCSKEEGGSAGKRKKLKTVASVDKWVPPARSLSLSFLFLAVISSLRDGRLGRRAER